MHCYIRSLVNKRSLHLHPPPLTLPDKTKFHPGIIYDIAAINSCSLSGLFCNGNTTGKKLHFEVSRYRETSKTAAKKTKENLVLPWSGTKL